MLITHPAPLSRPFLSTHSSPTPDHPQAPHLLTGRPHSPHPRLPLTSALALCLQRGLPSQPGPTAAVGGGLPTLPARARPETKFHPLIDTRTSTQTTLTLRSHRLGIRWDEGLRQGLGFHSLAVEQLITGEHVTWLRLAKVRRTAT